MSKQSKYVVIKNVENKNYGESGFIVEVQGNTAFVQMDIDGVILPFALKDLDYKDL
jgi:hypothetical protein